MSAISLKSITGITSITTPAGVDNQLTLHNNNTTEAVKLDTEGNLHFHNHLNITGVSTASNFKTGSTNVHSTGVELVNINTGGGTATFGGGITVAGAIDANGDLDVDGHTNLDNVSVAGITTTRDINIEDVSPRLTFFDTNADANEKKWDFKCGSNNEFIIQGINDAGVGGGHLFKMTRVSNTNGIDTFEAQKSGTTWLTISNEDRKLTTRDLDVTNNLDVDGHTDLDNVSIAGVTTITAGAFANNVDVGGRSFQTNIDIVSTSLRGGVTVRNANDFRTDNIGHGGFQVLDPYDSSDTSFAFRAAEGATLVDNAWIKCNGTAYFGSTVTIDGQLILPTTDQGIRFGPGDSANDDANIEWKGTSNAGYLRISTGDDSDSGGANEYIEFGDYAATNKGGTFTQHLRISRDQFLVRTGSHVITPADRLVINSIGLVGIGTVSPAARFDVYDTSGFGIVSRSASTQSTDENKALKVRNNSLVDTFNVSYKGQGYFEGKVGIGSTIPQAKLDVVGDILFNNRALITSDGGTGNVDHIWHSDSSNYGRGGTWNFVSDGAYKGTGQSAIQIGYLVNAGGGHFLDDVGIGLTNPDSKLTLAADSAQAIIELRRTNTNGGTGSYGAVNWTALDGHSVANIFAIGDGNDDGAHLIFKTTSAAASNDPYNAATVERLRITSDGKVGIGTDNPQKLLELEHVPNRKLQFSYDDNLITIKGSNNNNNPETIRLVGGNSIRFHTGTTGSGSEIVRITSDGKVGIGTDNPLSLLSLYSDADGEELLHFDMGSVADRRGWRFKQSSTGTTTKLNLESAANGKSFVVSAANGAEQFEVRTDSSNPFVRVQRHLHVDSDSSPSATGGILVQNVLYSTNQDFPYLVIGSQIWDGATTNWGTYGFQHRIKVNNDGVPRVTIDNNNGEIIAFLSNRNVGVGVTNPTHKLQVNGSFAATTKSFVIDHPTKEGMKLRHGSLEGPENGVYVRGRLKDNNTIELPDYWTGLVDEDTITVNLTPIGSESTLHKVVDIYDNMVIVGSENENINCFYTVFGERKDVEKMEVEY